MLAAGKAALIVLALVCVAGPPAANAGGELDAVIAAAVPEGFSGQIVIATPNQVLHSSVHGLADREAGKAVTDDMLFDMGSITKTFTATAVLKLAAAGQLSVDAPLSDYFDGLDAPKSDITIHQLLTHTSGLPEYSGEDEDKRTAASFDAWLAETALDGEPGGQYAYSNPGYSALARIVEKVSGQPYEAYLRQEVLQPLGIDGVGYVRLPRGVSEAVGYFEGEPGGVPSSREWLADGPGWNLRGNGGLLTSAASLMAFGQALARGDTLPAEQAAAQLTPHVREGTEPVWYGYGMGIAEREYGRVVSHNGGNGAFFAMLAWYPEHDVLLTLTNNAFDIEQVRAMLPALRNAAIQCCNRLAAAPRQSDAQ